jgi:hypothetical protein
LLPFGLVFTCLQVILLASSRGFPPTPTPVSAALFQRLRLFFPVLSLALALPSLQKQLSKVPEYSETNARNNIALCNNKQHILAHGSSR